MELTPAVKRYFEEHMELFKKDPLTFVKQCNFTNNDFECFLYCLQRVFKLFNDVEEKFDDYVKYLSSESLKISNKYPDAPTLIVAPFFNSKIVDSVENTVPSHMYLEATDSGAVPRSLPAGYTCNLDNNWFSLSNGNTESAMFTVKHPFKYITFVDFYTKEGAADCLKQLDDLLKDLQDKFYICLKSFEWRERAEDIIRDIHSKVVEAEPEYNWIISFYEYHNEAAVHCREIESKTKMDLSITVDWVSDPDSIDWDKTLDTWKKKMDKFRQNQAKSAARAAEKAAQRAANPVVQITRREVTAAIKAAGFTPSNYVYTNKYTGSITYKYQFMSLTPAECDLIKTELEKTGASVISVETKTSFSGRGAYNSLFVKVKN